MRRNDIINEYFEWLSSLVSEELQNSRASFKKLLEQLHNTRFRYSMMRDHSRADDGVELRYRFALRNGYEDYADEIMDDLYGPCSVLEMMIALALHCEETIMDDPRYGNRTKQWFWMMISNLGLNAMTDKNFDKRFVIDVLDRFLDREYEPNGRGGLFFVRGCDRDLRKTDIWQQMLCYLNTIS